MTSDADVDGTSRTVRQLLADDGDGTLPSLTREELFTLSDAPVLDHGGDRAWWDGLDDAGRELVAQTAQRGMVARNLLVLGADEGLDVEPRVRVILRARSEPAWLVVLGEPETSDVQIVASGIDLREHETTAVLLSSRLEGIYLNRLLGPHDAVGVLVEWLLRATEPDGATTGRTVEVLAPREPGLVDAVVSTRAIVLGNGRDWVLSDVDGDSGQPGEPRPADADVLREWLEARLALGGARLG